MCVSGGRWRLFVWNVCCVVHAAIYVICSECLPSFTFNSGTVDGVMREVGRHRYLR